MKILSTLVNSLFFVVAVCGQNVAPSPTLPSEPLLKPVPDFTKWTVTVRVEPRAAGSDSEKPINVISGSRTGNLLQVTTTAGNGNSLESWSDGKSQVTMNAKWEKPLVSVGEPPEYPRPDWISLRNYTGAVEQGGRTFLVFRARIFPDGGDQTLTAAELDGVDPETLKVDAQAYIDTETRLPASVQVGDEITVYKFEPLPAGFSLTLPPNVRNAIATSNQHPWTTRPRSIRP